VVSCYVVMTTLAVTTDVCVVYTNLLLDHSGMLLLKNEVQSFSSRHAQYFHVYTKCESFVA
jgi:hypothetical protein